MHGGGSSSGKKKARIEIIPLIDVVFFLLATFVLFTLSLNKLSSIPVTLPYSKPNETTTVQPDIVTLQISEADTLYWKQGSGNSESLTMSELVPRLASYKQAHPDTTKILITTDEKALFGQAVAVLDIIRKLDIEQVSIDTSKWHPTGQ